MMEFSFNDIPALCFGFNDAGILVGINDEALSSLGYGRSELQGEKLEKILTVPSKIFYQTHLFPLLKVAGVAEEIFISLLSKDGKPVPVLLNLRRKVNETSAYSLCTCIVVQNRKKFEDELVAARNAAQRSIEENTELLGIKQSLEEHAAKLDRQLQLISRRNMELSQLSYAITHTMKEPLRKILLNSSYLQEPKNDHLDNVRKAANRLKTVLDGVQRYLTVDERDMYFEDLELRSILEEAVSQVKLEAGENAFQLSMPPATIVFGDKRNLTILFSELITNAVTFRRTEVAQISVSAAEVQRNIYHSPTQHYQFKPFIKIDVTDFGKGISIAHKGELFRLFSKFYPSDGLGVGLALCKKILEFHHGFIEMVGKPDEFTTFSIWLPQKDFALS